MTMNQLNASSPSVAEDFYSDLFGWRFEPVMEEPPYWGIYNGERLNGGMMPLPPLAPTPSHWLVYFTVRSSRAPRLASASWAATWSSAPMPVPSGRFLVARDPQGAYFALFEGEVEP